MSRSCWLRFGFVSRGQDSFETASAFYNQLSVMFISQ